MVALIHREFEDFVRLDAHEGAGNRLGFRNRGRGKRLVGQIAGRAEEGEENDDPKSAAERTRR